MYCRLFLHKQRAAPHTVLHKLYSLSGFRQLSVVQRDLTIGFPATDANGKPCTLLFFFFLSICWPNLSTTHTEEF